ncbi:MAG: NUDIX domain-containing protein [Planctomycetota bacterium]|jgi:ADP-ribose pyrophosphatase
MTAIIIGIGLDNRFISPDMAFLARKESIGEAEIARLLGRGKTFGQGPLPMFLKHAADAITSGGNLAEFLISRPVTGRARDAQPNLDDVEVLDALKPLVGGAELVVVDEETALWDALQAAIRRVTGSEVGALNERDDLRFLIVGTHTENRVLAIASFLRNVLGARQVAVSAHLAASSSVEAHYATLRHNLPACGIQVLLDLVETAQYVGLPTEPFADLRCRPCEIGPEHARDSIPQEQLSIIESLCMHWSRTQLRPLQGGFSGSLLFLADGWKGQARTEPVVLKIDQFGQMRREISGYHQVKDFFGKHVPTFSHPVSLGDSVGVAMEFAAMEGRPETLQESFERAEDEESYRQFLGRFEKTLGLLAEKLHRNTSRVAWITPYRVFGLHVEQQQHYLATNLEHVLAYCGEASLPPEAMISADAIESMFRVVTANEDGIEADVCLVHGDLNYQNIIGDEAGNVWFIDWTHSGEYPVEMDFAKLENDVKFVMSKQFDNGDLVRLKQFEEYLLAEQMPAVPSELPDHLRHVKWDLRFRKILETVRLIRRVCFDIKRSEDWLVYQIALLRYATHTLSFDQRRGRGECELPQLLHAAYSVEALAFNLVSDDFHLRIRGERPPAYPPRQRISIDFAPWSVECPEYEPPYYVHESVLANDPEKVPGGWADPEDFAAVADMARFGGVRNRDGRERPLNPRGRTGLAGRGLLGRWGPNQAAAALVLRVSDDHQHADVLLGAKEQDGKLWLPKGFVQENEDYSTAIDRILQSETGWCPGVRDDHVVHEGYFYDPRQTDHAWVEIRAGLAVVEFDDAPREFVPGGDFETVRWMPVDADTVNRMPSAEARFVQQALRHLQQDGTIGDAMAQQVLSRSG